MTPPRALSLLVQPDQWARCAHDGTALLPDGGVELAWSDPAPAGPAPRRRPPATSGLAFDRWCRAYRSRPETGRVDVGRADARVVGAAPQPTLLRQPSGLAVDRRQRLYLAETGAGLLHVVDLWAQRLVRKVAVPGGRPLDVAPDCGRAIVLTGAPALLVIDGRRGPRPGPELVRPCYPPGLKPYRITSGPVVLWRARDGRSAAARPDGTVLIQLTAATDLDLGPDGLLVVGVAAGAALRRFQLDTQHGSASVAELEPAEALDYDGGAVSIAPSGRIGFTTAAGFGWTSGSAARHATSGSVVSYRLDSGAYRTRWGRLFLDACLPPGTAAGVRFVTTDDDVVLDPVDPRPPDRGARAVPDPEATPPLAPVHLLDVAAPESAVFRRPTGSERPWLPAAGTDRVETYETPVLAAPGRYLWIQLLLHGTEQVSPQVRTIRVERPGHALLTALPRAWSRDDEDASFLQRLLAPAEGLLHELDERAARRAVLVNPRAVPSEALTWLAGFAGLVLDLRWPEDARRALIEEAYPLYRRRGTAAALIQILALYLGRPPTLIENWQLRGLAGAVLGIRPGSATAPDVAGSAAQTGSLGRYLIGGPKPGLTSYSASAHRFTLLVAGQLTGEQRSVVQDILDHHRPAHTLAEVCELGAGMRIGDRLRVNLTSYVGPGTGWDPAVVGQVQIGGNGVVGLPAVGSRVADTAVVGQVRVG